MTTFQYLRLFLADVSVISTLKKWFYLSKQNCFISVAEERMWCLRIIGI
jgi:hypothetical protein